MQHLLRLLLITSFMVFGAALAAKPSLQIIPAYDSKLYDQVINKIYTDLKNAPIIDFSDRLAFVSEQFIGKRYLLGPLGEGPEGIFDQDPLYRTDAFDCTTLVETILALTLADDLKSFKKTINKIRYKNAQPSFVKRNHFMTVDWNPTNIQNGYLKDITYKITDAEGVPIAEVAETIINKPAWYKKLGIQTLRQFFQLPADKAANLVNELQGLANEVQQEKAVLLYLPLSKMYDEEGKPIQGIFRQIPTGSVIEIVRPNWDIKEIAGTNINVSHMGLAIRTESGLMYREASSIENKVIDIPLRDYLKQYLDSPTIKGINVQLIVKPNPKPLSLTNPKALYQIPSEIRQQRNGG